MYIYIELDTTRTLFLTWADNEIIIGISLN